jgi:hypothetical protein
MPDQMPGGWFATDRIEAVHGHLRSLSVTGSVNRLWAMPDRR